MSSVPSSIASKRTARTNAVWWKACTKSKNMIQQTWQSWNYNIKTILYEMRNCDMTLRSSANGHSYLIIIKLHRYPLDHWPDATQLLYYLLQLDQISSLRRHFSPLSLAKVGGWSWCNSALHLIIGAFRDNGEGRWNQFPASSTNMGQPSSPSTPSSLSYLSIRQVWNEDGRWRNTADWFDLHSCSTFLEAFRCW